MLAHAQMVAFNLGARVSFAAHHVRAAGTLVKRICETAAAVTDNGVRGHTSTHMSCPVEAWDRVESANTSGRPEKRPRVIRTAC